jgi:hypothetical protein
MCQQGKEHGLPPDTRGLFDSLSRLREFTVTEDHLKLLRHARISWDPGEFYGAPAINSKRPYGNSQVVEDVAELVQAPDSDYEWTEEEVIFPQRHTARFKHLRTEAAEGYLHLHVQTAIALQIVLATGEFRPGRYRREGYIGWERDDGSP